MGRVSKFPAELLQQIASDRKKTSWARISRPEQKIPSSPWTYWLIMAGRGWGKTRTGAEAVSELIAKRLAKRVALVGRTALEVRQIMLEGDSGLLTLQPSWIRPTYSPSLRRVPIYPKIPETH